MEMKRLTIFSIAVLATTLVSFGQQQPIVISPKVQDVTVYLSGAEIRFQEAVALKRGENTIIFRGLSHSLIENSTHVTTGASTELVSVSTQSEELLPEEISAKVRSLKDSVAGIEERIVLINNQLDAYDMEKKTLAQNQHIGGAQTGVSLIELNKAAEFFRDRTLKINNALTSLHKELKLLNALLLRKTEELNREQRRVNTIRYAVEVIVNSKTDQTVDLTVRHLVADASWEASYDIVATDIGKPVTLRYKAEVYNNTGIDWHDVNLTLSTGDISVDASRPYLTAWVLNYTSTANEGFLNNRWLNTKDLDSTAMDVTEQRTVSELNTSFEIEQRHSIRSGSQPYRINIQSEILQASFEYLTVPKMELSAFLIAKLTGWEKLNLIDGTANVYYGNTFVGESNVDTRLIGDTLELSLGRDNQIVVNRAKIEDKGGNSSLSGKRSESFVYEIQVRNNRKVPVSIKVQDQIPISQEKDITVEVASLSGAALDAASGRLQWIKDLAPGEASRDRIDFTVRYPKNRTVSIRKSRVVSTPRYRH
jgi:uncharacterized protein (TIGR02231 family)